MLYKNIQGLRAVAALMVVISHIYWPILPMRIHWTQQFVTAVGPGGVDLFFVISGFVVFLAAQRLGDKAEVVGRVSAFREFAIKRVFRIYPIYWVVFAIATLLMPWVEFSPAFIKVAPTWQQVLLINSPNSRVQAAWTLQYEMYFYAMCALGILFFPRRIALILGAWFAMVAAASMASWFGVSTSSSWLNILALEFGLGIVIALLASRKYSEYAVAAIGVGLAGYLWGAIYFNLNGGWTLPSSWRVVCFGLPSALIVYGFVALEIRQMWTFSKGWVALGDASYSLYLWHQVLFATIAAWLVAGDLINRLPAPIYGVAFVCVAVLVGFLSFNLIEQPINKSAWLARLAKGSSGIVAREPVPA
ncbi:acyltransferase [Mesorhizobium salmacidum]|uniref:Acyltransferase n=1 Tax=Mesorhizobium salmacidum TaxID=3015171 RepID=A0ABU8KQD3_9HYPH